MTKSAPSAIFGSSHFFDQGWQVKEGMTGVIYAIHLDDWEIAVDFNEALRSGRNKGDIV